MAYDTKELEDKAVLIIQEKKCFFIQDVIPFLPCSCSTFYDKELEKSEAIKDALEFNRTEIKVSMRSKWYKSSNPTLQIALMRMICTNEERRKLAMNYSEVTGRDGTALVAGMSDEEKDDLVKRIKDSDE